MIESFAVAAILLGCLCVVLKWADRERAEQEQETPVQFVYQCPPHWVIHEEGVLRNEKTGMFWILGDSRSMTEITE